MKKLLLSGSLTTLLLLAACGTTNEVDTSESNTETNDEASDLVLENEQLKEQIATLETEIEELKIAAESDNLEEKEIDEESTTDGSATSRSNPASVGDSISYKLSTYDDESNSIPGSATLKINEVIRGDEAVSILDTSTLDMEELPEGYEWAVFDFTVTIDEIENPDESVHVWGSDFKVHENDGSEAPSDIFHIFDGRYNDEEIYEGGTTSGKLDLVVPIGEPFQLRYGDGFSIEEVFISVE